MAELVFDNGVDGVVVVGRDALAALADLLGVGAVGADLDLGEVAQVRDQERLLTGRRRGSCCTSTVASTVTSAVR